MVLKTPNNYLFCSLGQQHGDINEQNEVNLCSRSCGSSPATSPQEFSNVSSFYTALIMWDGACIWY